MHHLWRISEVTFYLAPHTLQVSTCFFEEVYLVAQDGGDLEIEAGSGFAHFFFQAGNGGGHIGCVIALGGHEGAEVVIGVLQFIIRGVEAQGALVGAADALRSNAVCLCVSFPIYWK